MYLNFRNDENSFSRGVLSEEQYERGKKRSIVSLKLCFIVWLYELAAVASCVLTPFIQGIGVPNVYLVDAIIMFVVIPLVHLMNDEETKAIIYERNWYQGFRHMLGMYTEPELKISTQPKWPTKSSTNRINQSEQKSKVTLLSPKLMSIRRYHSNLSLVPSKYVTKAPKQATGQRSNSLSEIFLIQQIYSHNKNQERFRGQERYLNTLLSL